VDSISISSGAKHIAIDRDGERVGEIVFSPEDVVLAEKFYKLVGEFEVKSVEFSQRAEAIEGDIGAGIALLNETCLYFRDRIDYLLGAGVSLMVFGNTNTLDMFSQFFEGITPHFHSARVDKMKQYIKPTNGKRPKRK
jgi:hypothetical protein